MRKIKFVKGNIYHIFNRGVEKRDIFKNDADKWRFVQGMFLFNNQDVSSNILWKLENEKGGLNFKTLRDYIENNKKERKPLVKILTDCMMPNHYHLLLKEVEDSGTSRFMHKFGVGYTKYFNKKHNRVGSLYQGTFKAVPVENELHLQYLLIYINILNPAQLIEPELKEKGIKDIDRVMKFAENYPWSANQEYLGKRNSIIIEKDIFEGFFPDRRKYEEFAKNVLLDRKTESIPHLTLE